eukprot:1391014-Lingulodinium_polyedra.AAC.1
MPPRPRCTRRLAAPARRRCILAAGAECHAARRPAADRRWVAVSGPHGRWSQQGAARAGWIAVGARLCHPG